MTVSSMLIKAEAVDIVGTFVMLTLETSGYTPPRSTGRSTVYVVGALANDSLEERAQYRSTAQNARAANGIPLERVMLR